jgi:hypothetical protein
VAANDGTSLSNAHFGGTGAVDPAYEARTRERPVFFLIPLSA